MDFEGNERIFPWNEEYGRLFKGMKKVIKTSSMFSMPHFSPTLVIRYLWKYLNDVGFHYGNGCIPCQQYEIDHIYFLLSLQLVEKKWVNKNY